MLAIFRSDAHELTATGARCSYTVGLVRNGAPSCAIQFLTLRNTVFSAYATQRLDVTRPRYFTRGTMISPGTQDLAKGKADGPTKNLSRA
jgi:hypothetical protein